MRLFLFISIFFAGVATAMPLFAQEEVLPDTCNPDEWERITARAYWEGRRDVDQIHQALLMNQDSVLEFSCFQHHAEEAELALGRLFNPPIFDSSPPPYRINFEDELEDLILQTLFVYLENNHHGFRNPDNLRSFRYYLSDDNARWAYQHNVMDTLCQSMGQLWNNAVLEVNKISHIRCSPDFNLWQSESSAGIVEDHFESAVTPLSIMNDNGAAYAYEFFLAMGGVYADKTRDTALHCDLGPGAFDFPPLDEGSAEYNMFRAFQLIHRLQWGIDESYLIYTGFEPVQPDALDSYLDILYPYNCSESPAAPTGLVLRDGGVDAVCIAPGCAHNGEGECVAAN